MNQTLAQQAHLRQLRHRIETARAAVTQQIVERETAIREHGVAHPHTVEASRRLNNTRGLHRRMSGAYAIAMGAHARVSTEDR